MSKRLSTAKSTATSTPSTTLTTLTPTPPTTPVLPTIPDGQNLDALRLALGAPEAPLRRILFRNAREEDLVEQGARVDSLNIVADIPRFVTSGITILNSLDPARRARVLLPLGIFAVLVDESILLDGMKRDHEQTAILSSGERTKRETTLRREMSLGVALREQSTSALGHALGEDRLKELRTLVGDASIPENLGKGMNAVAIFLDRVLAAGDADDAEALAYWQVGSSQAASLRAQAALVLSAGAVVANTGRRVSQRSLDVQDGRVLLLVDQTLRAFRTAHRADRSILVPELNRIAWLFDTSHASSRKSPKAPAPAAPAAEKEPAVAKEPEAPAADLTKGFDPR